MSDVIVVPSAAVEALRRKAKQLVRARGIAHHAALDEVARAGGVFSDWHHLIEAAKATEPSELAYKTGLVIGMDYKDSDRVPAAKRGDFLEDEKLAQFVALDFERQHSEPRSDEDQDYLQFIKYERRYFRTTQIVPDTLEAAMRLARQVFSLPPEYLRLKGKVLWDLDEYGDE
jgi:hypothetical protein